MSEKFLRGQTDHVRITGVIELPAKLKIMRLINAMPAWRITDWPEVERLALANRTCISPGKPNYEAARSDFQRRSVRYTGFSYASLFSQEPIEGYSRLLPDSNGDRRIFVDYTNPYGTTMTERFAIYACLDEIAELMSSEGFLHFYLKHSESRYMYFADREKRRVTPAFAWDQMPSHTMWTTPETDVFIDLLSRVSFSTRRNF